LSVEEKKDTEQKTPKWESKLWSYLSSGDGEHCPLYSRCRFRLQGHWCFDDNRESLNRADEHERFKITDYNSIKPESSCTVFKLVEGLAQAWLREAGIRCPPVPAEIVALVDEKNPVEIRQLLLKHCRGAIWHLKDSWVIQLNNQDTPFRQRFTLFHEIFHLLAHRKATPVFSKRGAKEGAFNELLADGFAAYILMPAEWVKGKWVECQDLGQMAKIFQVPKQAMCIRLKYDFHHVMNADVT